jgi:nucleoside-diphosphate-sugar epimerase
MAGGKRFSMNTLLAIGLGYSATEIAPRLRQAGWRIIGSGRGEDRLRAIRAKGYDAVPFDGESPSPALAEAMSEATHLLISTAPAAKGDPVLRWHSDDLAKAPHLKWIGYLSTIGVYGDHEGAWVDETTPPQPSSDRSIGRLGAENAWQSFAEDRGTTLQIFRLAGIYGPGRNQFEKLRAGREQRIYKPGQVFNRIHVDDIAATVIAGIEAGNAASGVFNVTDDEPAPPQDVIAYAAELLGMEPPPLVDWNEADMSPMARSFYSENKRVRNERIKKELGVRLNYPTYREGLRALLDETAN